MTDQQTMEEMRDRIERLEAGLETIANKDSGECAYYYDDEVDKTEPQRYCSCDRCIARRALRQTPTGYDWRYRGVMHKRVQTNPREARMIRAWSDKVGDHELGLVMFGGDRMSFPTARDWYVATSVVQWLATNVGMGVLEAAGFHYTRWDEDKAIDIACDVADQLGKPNKPKHPTQEHD